MARVSGHTLVQNGARVRAFTTVDLAIITKMVVFSR